METSVTGNSRSWQYIAKNMHEKALFLVSILQKARNIFMTSLVPGKTIFPIT